MNKQTIATIIYGILCFTVLAIQYSAFVIDHFLTLNGDIDEDFVEYKFSVTFKSHKVILTTFNHMFEIQDQEEIIYADQCENGMTESQREQMCKIAKAGDTFFIANSIVAFLIILLLLMKLCKPVKLRFAVSVLSIIIGVLLIVIYAVTLGTIKKEECALAEKLKEKAGPAAKFVLDEEKFCLNNEESYLEVKVENSLKLLLAAGIMLSFVGLTFPIVIKKLFDNESQENGSKETVKADISKYDDIDHEQMMLMTDTNIPPPPGQDEDEDDFWG